MRRFFETPPPGHFENDSAPPSLVGALDFLVFVERVHPAVAR